MRLRVFPLRVSIVFLYVLSCSGSLEALTCSQVLTYLRHPVKSLKTHFAESQRESVVREIKNPEIAGDSTLIAIEALKLIRTDAAQKYTKPGLYIIDDTLTYLRFRHAISSVIKMKFADIKFWQLEKAVRKVFIDSLKIGLWMVGPNIFKLMSTLRELRPNQLKLELSKDEKDLLQSRGISLDVLETIDCKLQELNSHRPLKRYRRIMYSLRQFAPTILALLFMHDIYFRFSRPEVNNLTPNMQIYRHLAADPKFDFLGKKVSIIVDANKIKYNLFIPPRLANTEPLVVDASLQYIAALNENTASYSVNTPLEFISALRDSADSDIIIVNGHGMPGDLLIGHEFLKSYGDLLNGIKFKDGAVIIFSSCSYGDRESLDGKPEPFMQLADKWIAGNGFSVAAINTTTFVLVPIISKNFNYSQLGLRAVSSVSGLYSLITYFERVSSTTPSSFGPIKGFRIYDQAAKTTRLIQLTDHIQYDEIMNEFAAQVAGLLEQKSLPEHERKQKMHELALQTREKLFAVENVKNGL